MTTNPRPTIKYRKINHQRLSRKWLLAGSLVLSGLLVFLVIGATKSSELDLTSQPLTTDTQLQANNYQLPTINYTDLLGNQILNELLNQLPADSVDSEENFQALKQAKLDEVERSVAQTDTNAVFVTNISNEQILTSTNNSKDAIQQYLTKLTEITVKTQKPLINELLVFVETNKNPDPKNPDPLIDLAQKSVQQYSAAFNESRQLIVPNMLVSQHKDYLAIVLESQNVFQTLANVKQDPYKALLALAHMDKLTKRGEALEQNVISVVKPIFYGQ